MGNVIPKIDLGDQEKIKEIYKKYLGPDYEVSYTEKFCTILCNHVSFVESYFCMYRYASGFIGKLSASKIPTIREMGKYNQTIYLDRQNPDDRSVLMNRQKLAGVINKTNTTIIFINQLREKIGIMFGNPETTTGGRALKFFSTMRIDVRRIDSIKAGDQVLGNRTRAKIVKNKVAPPFKQAEFDIMYGTGISKSGDILDCAVDAGLLEKAGSWYSYKGDRIGQGRENVKAYLETNPQVMDELQGQLLDMLTASRRRDDEAADELAGPDGLLVDEDGVIID